jgi:hypothetical protein
MLVRFEVRGEVEVDSGGHVIARTGDPAEAADDDVPTGSTGASTRTRASSVSSRVSSVLGSPRRAAAAALMVVAGATWLGAARPAAASDMGCLNAGARVGASGQLPDCRAYEQVSPVAKGGYDASSRSSSLQFPAQAAADGEAMAYMGFGPLAGAEGSGLPDARVSRRTASGWQTLDVTPPTPRSTPGGILGYDFSEDLFEMVVKVPYQDLSGSLPPGSERLYNLYLRGSDATYSLVNSAPPSVFPPEGCVQTCVEFFDTVAFAGASSDFSRVLFEADDSLEGTGGPTGFFSNLYVSSRGSLQLVGLLPDGTVAAGGAVAGAGGPFLGGVTYSSVGPGAFGDVSHAISGDGTRVLFEATADGGQPDPAQSGMTELYDRINAERTVEVSAPAAGATPANTTPEPAQFWAASIDGSRAFFTSAAELTTQSRTGSANNTQDLYRYDVGTGSLLDLSVDTNAADAATGAGVQGVVGASSDGAYVYFVATGQLVAGQGVDGQPNLYVFHEDLESHQRTLRFVATLAPPNEANPEQEPGDSRDWTATPSQLQAYVTPDGRHLAFMSLNSLTGYQNLDQSGGGRDSEVYEYSAETAELACASCDPSGAPPVGSAFIGATHNFTASTPFHQPRVLSDDGRRLFFSSPDPLLAGAASGRAKVYEREQNGVGSCATPGGCLYLISSGGNETDDMFLDASSTGADVFFGTLSRLVSTDGDNLFDVYDARVGGGFPAQLTPSSCTTGCQPFTPAAQAPSPLVSGSNGPTGNLSPQPEAKGKRPKMPSCRARAKRLQHGGSHRRMFKRCAKPRSRKPSRRTAR